MSTTKPTEIGFIGPQQGFQKRAKLPTSKTTKIGFGRVCTIVHWGFNLLHTLLIFPICGGVFTITININYLSINKFGFGGTFSFDKCFLSIATPFLPEFMDLASYAISSFLYRLVST